MAREARERKTETTETETETVTETTAGTSASDAAERVISATEEVKKKRGRPRKEKPREEYKIDVSEGDIYLAGALGSTVFSIIGPMVHMAPLTEKQTRALGEAIAPLVVKYMPLVGAWQYEIAAILTVSAIVIEARQNYVPPKKETADDEPAAARRDAPGEVASAVQG